LPRHRDQSTSAARDIAGESGFFTFTQYRLRNCEIVMNINDDLQTLRLSFADQPLPQKGAARPRL
jgi:hypothetical protein